MTRATAVPAARLRPVAATAASVTTSGFPVRPLPGQATVIAAPPGAVSEIDPEVPGVAVLLACGAPPLGGVKLPEGAAVVPDGVDVPPPPPDPPPPPPPPPPAGAVTCVEALALLLPATGSA